jgi:hypothetical protein
VTYPDKFTRDVIRIAWLFFAWGALNAVLDLVHWLAR